MEPQPGSSDPRPSVLDYASFPDGDGLGGEQMRRDIEEIRAKVLQGKPQPTTPYEGQEIYEKIKEKHQIDLNQEGHAQSLEDPSLLAHMEAARARLDKFYKTARAPPHLETLRCEFSKQIGRMSQFMKDCKTRVESEKEKVEYAHFNARAFNDLTSGRTPHGYPGPLSGTTGGAASALFLAKTQKAATNYEELLQAHEQIQNDLFMLRREIERTGEDFIAAIEELTSERQLLRELIQIQNKA